MASATKKAFRLSTLAVVIASCVQSPSSTTVVPSAPPPDAARILVIGDWGSNDRNQIKIADAMSAVAQAGTVDAIVTTGDNFYSDAEDEIMRPYDWAIDAGIPFWVSWGNHDIESGERIEDMNRVFSQPARWRVQEWGAVDILILDSNSVGERAQLDFIEEYMTSIDRPVIVVFHHPAWSCSNHGSTGTIVDSWLPLLDEDVVLVMSGHDHNYQRLSHEGVTFIVTGGGGRRLYGLKECEPGHPELEAGVVEHHFLIVDQMAETLIVTAHDADLNELDRVTVSFNP